jgi:hypothetical protein
MGPAAPVVGRAAWRAAWADRRFRAVALVAALALVVTMAAFARFVAWVEDRPGAVLDDPVLPHVDPVSLNAPTFALIYGSIALALVVLVPRPRALVVAVAAYTLVVLVRALMMWLTPLDPPAGLIPLVDPVVERLGSGRGLTRDLFFSGHVATGSVLALATPVPWARAVLVLATVAVGALTLVQHAHYAVDVVVAPFVAFGCHRAARRLA